LDTKKKLLERYDYAAHMRAGGFMVNGKPALTQIDPELVARYVVITVRDPLLGLQEESADILSHQLEDRVLAGKSALFTTYSGKYKGTEISIVSGGSGSSEAELVLVEFMQHTKADTFIRLGGAGGISAQARVGDVVIASGVVRDEGMTRDYITPAYPAASNYEVVAALAQGAEDAGVSYRIGVARSSDSEHVGVGRPSVDDYFQPRHMELLDYYDRANILYTDRESAAVVTLCGLFGRRGGAVCSVGNSLLTGEEFTPGLGARDANRTVLEGLSRLSQMDHQKACCNKEYWTPSLWREDVKTK